MHQVACYVLHSEGGSLGGGGLPGTMQGLFKLPGIWMDMPASFLAISTRML